MIVGYLVQGKFVCPDCVRDSLPEGPTPRVIEVHKVNMGQYSQKCGRCREQTVTGEWKAELFPTEEDPNELRWTHVQQLLVAFDQAIMEEDDEAALTAKREIYERYFRAEINGKLFDKKMILQAIDKIMSVEHRW